MMAGLIVTPQGISIAEIANNIPFRELLTDRKRAVVDEEFNIALAPSPSAFVTLIPAPDNEKPDVLLYEERM